MSPYTRTRGVSWQVCDWAATAGHFISRQMLKLDRFGFRIQFLCAQSDIVLPGECIQPVASSNSSEMDILNNLNISACFVLNGKSDDTKPVITKLQVNKTCVNGSDVSKIGS